MICGVFLLGKVRVEIWEGGWIKHKIQISDFRFQISDFTIPAPNFYLHF
jgi:hypothetical protein